MKAVARVWISLVVIALVLGGFSVASAQGADDPGEVEAGQAIYAMGCAACHGDDGTGVAQRGRPLIGVAAEADRAQHIASITDGKGNMPGFAERFNEEEISAVASYVRLTFVEAAAEPELAHTGSETPALIIGGVTAIVAGAALVSFQRRRIDD